MAASDYIGLPFKELKPHGIDWYKAFEPSQWQANADTTIAVTANGPVP